MMSRSERGTAVVNALAPYPWRGLTASMLARRALAALDRFVVERLLAEVAAADPGPHGVLEPVPRHDERVEVLVEALGRRNWQASHLPALCLDLLATLDAWDGDRRTLEAALWRLLDEPL